MPSRTDRLSRISSRPLDKGVSEPDVDVRLSAGDDADGRLGYLPTDGWYHPTPKATGEHAGTASAARARSHSKCCQATGDDARTDNRCCAGLFADRVDPPRRDYPAKAGIRRATQEAPAFCSFPRALCRQALRATPSARRLSILLRTNARCRRAHAPKYRARQRIGSRKQRHHASSCTPIGEAYPRRGRRSAFRTTGPCSTAKGDTLVRRQHPTGPQTHGRIPEQRCSPEKRCSPKKQGGSRAQSGSKQQASRRYASLTGAATLWQRRFVLSANLAPHVEEDRLHR